jgi:hypothetical protein
MWPPLFMPAPPELKRTGDPEVARVETENLATGVKNAAIPRPRTAKLDRFNLTHRGYTIASWHHAVHLLSSQHEITKAENNAVAVHILNDSGVEFASYRACCGIIWVSENPFFAPRAPTRLEVVLLSLISSAQMQ